MPIDNSPAITQALDDCRAPLNTPLIGMGHSDLACFDQPLPKRSH